MLEFVRNVFRRFFSIVLWVCVIGFAIAGGVTGAAWGGGGGAFFGVILGIIFGIVFDIICGGIVATLLNMDENLQIIANSAKGGNNMPQAQGSIPNAGSRTMVGNKLQKKCMKCKKEVDDDYSACPHCGNNTFE